MSMPAELTIEKLRKAKKLFMENEAEIGEKPYIIAISGSWCGDEFVTRNGRYDRKKLAELGFTQT